MKADIPAHLIANSRGINLAALGIQPEEPKPKPKPTTMASPEKCEFTCTYAVDFSHLITGLRLISEANEREHWSKKYSRSDSQKLIVAIALSKRPELQRMLKAHFDEGGIVFVKFTRFGPKKLDKDNLAGAFKHVQDAVAAYYDLDDGDERWVWEYDYALSKKYALLIQLNFLKS